MKLLIVGCGSIGRRHAKIARKLADTAIIDLDKDLTDKCAQDLKVLSFYDLQKALEWKPDGVVIASSTSSHIPLATQCIQSGFPVLIEKPLSHNLKEGKKFVELVQEKKNESYVVCNMRFHPAISTLRDNLEAIGTPYFARAHFGNYLPNMRPGTDYRELYCAKRDKGGGLALDCIHEIDYLMWLFGPVSKTRTMNCKLSDLEIDVEDYTSLCLKHDSKVVSEIHLDYLRPFKRRGCEIVGENGMLLWQSEGKQPEQCKVHMYLSALQKWKTIFNSSQLDVDQPFSDLLLQFFKAIQGQDHNLLEVKTAYEELVIAHKAIEEGLS
mgnify:CR=1 FL=1